MAINIEQEKKPVNWIGFFTACIVIAVLFFGGYFLFFKKPELIEIVVPGSLKDVSIISRISFDPESVVGSPTFRLLRQYATTISPPTPGKSNPFKSF